eukprot:3819583-Pleurochrysis_carterae.AAC.2
MASTPPRRTDALGTRLASASIALRISGTGHHLSAALDSLCSILPDGPGGAATIEYGIGGSNRPGV